MSVLLHGGECGLTTQRRDLRATQTRTARRQRRRVEVGCDGADVAELDREDRGTAAHTRQADSETKQEVSTGEPDPSIDSHALTSATKQTQAAVAVRDVPTDDAWSGGDT